MSLCFLTPRSLLLPVLVAVLAGCSGGDDGAEQAKAAYVSQAQAVCDTAAAEFAELETPTAPDAFAPFVAQTLSIAETAQGELAALTPPELDAAELSTRVLDPFAELVEQGRDFAAEVEAAGSDGAALLPLLGQRPSAEGIDLEFLRGYGLQSCADAIDDLG